MNEYINRQAVLDLLWKDGRITTPGVKAIPAADVAPVVHGWWDDNGTGIIICSECGSGYNLIARHTHYCPNCGAKMDKEADDAK